MTKTQIKFPQPIRRPEPIPGLPGLYHSPASSWPGVSRGGFSRAAGRR